MYKKQLKFQKLVCLLCLLAAAVSFVYSLGIMTDLYDALYYTIPYPDMDKTMTTVPGSIVFYDMQDFDRLFVNLNVGLILLAAVMLLTNTHSRRKYYLGNYVSIGLFSAATLGVCAWSHFQIEAFKHQFQTTVDFEALKAYAEQWKSLYLGPEDTFWFDLHYAVAAICLVMVGLLIANMIWKIQLMRSENELIRAGEEAVSNESGR